MKDTLCMPKMLIYAEELDKYQLLYIIQESQSTMNMPKAHTAIKRC